MTSVVKKRDVKLEDYLESRIFLEKSLMECILSFQILNKNLIIKLLSLIIIKIISKLNEKACEFYLNVTIKYRNILLISSCFKPIC